MTPEDRETLDRFARLFFKHWAEAKKTWLGTYIVKYPNDLFLYQQIIFENKPDVIVETGAYMGGSALFFATMCDLVGHGQVVSVDIKDRPNRPRHPRLTYVIGRSTSDEVLKQVHAIVDGKTCMAVLDSDHQANHVKRELTRYGRDMVTPGQYCIVEDTMLDSHDIGWKHDVGPAEAVKWFMARDNHFEIVPLENNFLLSMCPGGFLRRKTDESITSPTDKSPETAAVHEAKTQGENEGEGQKPGPSDRAEDVQPVAVDPAPQTTIVYYTDDSLPLPFAEFVRKRLLAAAEGKPIVSVSHQPLDFGQNVCVGKLERSHLSMYKQMYAGALAAKTRYIALAEHDCLYTPEHFNWIPPQEDVFYYNVNHWFVQHGGERSGQYSYQRRRPLSQLICGREVFLRAVEEKIWMLENGWMIRKGMAGACEPGCRPPEEAMVKVPVEQMMAALPCEPGVDATKQEYVAALAEFKDLGKELGRWKAEAFRTQLPNLDIRHGGNFSGGRRGQEKAWELPYWGKWEDVYARSIAV